MGYGGRGSAREMVRLCPLSLVWQSCGQCRYMARGLIDSQTRPERKLTVAFRVMQQATLGLRHPAKGRASSPGINDALIALLATRHAAGSQVTLRADTLGSRASGQSFEGKQCLPMPWGQNALWIDSCSVPAVLVPIVTFSHTATVSCGITKAFSL